MTNMENQGHGNLPIWTLQNSLYIWIWDWRYKGNSSASLL